MTDAAIAYLDVDTPLGGLRLAARTRRMPDGQGELPW